MFSAINWLKRAVGRLHVYGPVTPEPGSLFECVNESWHTRGSWHKRAYVGTRHEAKDLMHKERLVRPERFELPTSWFVAMRSIQLSYGRSTEMADDFSVAHPFAAALSRSFT